MTQHHLHPACVVQVNQHRKQLAFILNAYLGATRSSNPKHIVESLWYHESHQLSKLFPFFDQQQWLQQFLRGSSLSWHRTWHKGVSCPCAKIMNCAHVPEAAITRLGEPLKTKQLMITADGAHSCFPLDQSCCSSQTCDLVKGQHMTWGVGGSWLTSTYPQRPGLSPVEIDKKWPNNWQNVDIEKASLTGRCLLREANTSEESLCARSCRRDASSAASDFLVEIFRPSLVL